MGDDKGWQQCALNMIDHKPDYYQEILATCTGRQSCEDLRVDTQGEIWCPGSTFYADDITYIQVLYNCDPGMFNFYFFVCSRTGRNSNVKNGIKIMFTPGSVYLYKQSLVCGNISSFYQRCVFKYLGGVYVTHDSKKLLQS